LILLSASLTSRLTGCFRSTCTQRRLQRITFLALSPSSSKNHLRQQRSTTRVLHLPTQPAKYLRLHFSSPGFLNPRYRPKLTTPTSKSISAIPPLLRNKPTSSQLLHSQHPVVPPLAMAPTPSQCQSVRCIRYSCDHQVLAGGLVPS